jgi:hypothetical protein
VLGKGKTMKKHIFGLTLLTAGALLFAVQDRVEFKTIDGIPHVLNPAKPPKGTINLEVERTRTIDPYEQPDVGLRMILFSRDETGQVILYDPNGAEAHRFGPDGKYLGLLTNKGQGPGEFSPMQGYRAYFSGPDIWVFGGRKVARFDGGGILIKDKVLKNRCYSGVDAERFLTIDTRLNENRDQVWTLRLIEFSMEGEESGVDLLQAINIGMIKNPSGQGGFGDSWGTPNFFYTADPDHQRILCGLNTEYKIQVKDYSGKDILVILKAHENVKTKKADIEKRMSWALKNENSKWMISAYPARYIAIKDVKPLPQGYLAAFRVSGPEMFEIDIFSPKGEYLYALIPPPDVKMTDASFFSTGFATVEKAEDYSVYREYRIKNLPEIFGK